MNEKRWVCPAHPDTTIGATDGESEPMKCRRIGCGREMKIVTPGDSRVQHTEERVRKPSPRRESKPL